MLSLKSSITLLISCVCVFAAISQIATEEVCQTCMENNAYCLNETHYHVCYDGKNPNTKLILECEDDMICTNDGKICKTQQEIDDDTANTIKNVCKDADTCNQCSSVADKPKLACVSKTQYALCVGGKPLIGSTESCGSEEICSVDSYETGEICLPECVAEYLSVKVSCDNEVTTPLPTPTSAPIDFKAHCQLNCGSVVAGYCNTHHPTLRDCKSYVYCEKDEKDNWFYAVIQCPAGLFYEDGKQKCTTTPCAS